jgi:hypothetical protein
LWILDNNVQGGEALWNAAEWVRLLDKSRRLRL